MKRKFIQAMTITMSMAFVFTFLGGRTVKAADAVKVTKITANTYVGDVGQMVDSFEITVDDITKVSGLKAADFDIASNYNGYTEKDGSSKIYTDDGIVLTTSGNTIKIDVKDFKYSGAPNPANPYGPSIPFSVTSSKYSTLDFDATKITNLLTKTVDKFEKLTFTGSNGVTIPYRLYSANTGKPEPLVLFMHGSGEVGTDNVKQITASRGAVAFAESGYTTNVIAAQYPYSYSRALSDTELKDMNNYFDAYEELINKLVKAGKVDKDRIYVTGLSMGGGLDLRFLLAKPSLFAASVVMSARNSVDLTNVHLSELSSIKTLPIWLFHCEDDGLNTSKTSKDVYNELVKLGDSKAKLTIYTSEFMDSLGFYGIYPHHASWVPTLNNKDMMSWLFSQSKTPKAPGNLKVTKVNTSTSQLTWDAVSGASGYEIYKTTQKGGKLFLVGTTTTTNLKNYHLAAGRGYYYQVKAYKIVEGVKVYSDLCQTRYIKM